MLVRYDNTYNRYSKDHVNKSGAPLAYRAFQYLGIEYRQAGCLSKVDNADIGVLCKPLRASSKAVICFAYTDVGKGREQDAVALSGNLERTRHSTAFPFAHLTALELAEKTPDLFSCS